jgi:hypothetical protein
MVYHLDAGAFDAALRQYTRLVSRRRKASVNRTVVRSELLSSADVPASEFEAVASGTGQLHELQVVRLARTLGVRPTSLIRRRPGLVELP